MKQSLGGGGGGGGGGGRGGAANVAPDPAESPQPAIENIEPYAIVQGSPGVTLHLKGMNFVRRSLVYFDGISVPYTRVSPTQLDVTLDANMLARAGRFTVEVKNPLPVADDVWGDDGVSNPAHFMVSFKTEV